VIEEPGVTGNQLPRARRIGPPLRSPIAPLTSEVSLALVEGDDEGPRDGLTLDVAIERLLRENLELRSKAIEIPEADADILTAGLRANPILYTDSQLVPYGEYSRARPGGQTQYDINLTYPLDLSRKRQARTRVACQARRVLEAQYQDAVRIEIDNLYTQFVDLLAARETVREARRSVEELERKPKRAPPAGSLPGKAMIDDHRHEIQTEAAEIGLMEAEEDLRDDRRTLGRLLRIPIPDAERLEVRGSLRDRSARPLLGEPLLRLALASRPDLAAYRLGVGRAEADVSLALANRYQDVFFMYQPYTFQNNAPLNAKSAHSWGVGMAIPLPLFNRNQGNIQRAKLNVAQVQTDLEALIDQVIAEVRQAERQYLVTRAAVERLERSLLPAAKEAHDKTFRLYGEGRVDELTFLTAERDYDVVVRQHRDTLVRHRRSMLRLNTAVGQRILP
jgi:cobalt-zinc-cadmium efflux system outer membrane protein